MATVKQKLFHLDHRLLRIALRTIGVLLQWKVRFEGRLQHQHLRGHADPVSQCGYAERSKLAVGFRNENTSDRVRPVRPFPERKRQFAEPPLHPVRRNVREVLTIHTRCALFGAALGVGVGQNVFAERFVLKGVEGIPGFRLRFRVQRPLQLLNIHRS